MNPSTATATTTCRAVVTLLRLSNLPTVGTNVLTGVILAGSAWQPGDLSTLIIAIASLYCSGMAFNDLFDLRHDCKHNPLRPVASGALSLQLARAWAFGLALFALALLVWRFGAVRASPALALCAAILAYDAWHKKTAWSVLLMGLCRALAVLVPAALVTLSPAPAAIFAAAGQGTYVLILTAIGRWRSQLPFGGWTGLMPALLAGISLLDGVFLGWAMGLSGWLIGGAAALLTWILNHQWVSGD